MQSHKPKRRVSEAERILADTLAAARTDAVGADTSFAMLRSRTEARERADAAGEHTFMSTITRPITSHRTLSFGVVFAALVFALATLVPFEYQQTIGYMATYDNIDPATGFNAERLESALTAVGYADAGFEIRASFDGISCSISGLPSRYAVREVTAALATLTGFAGAPTVEPLRETVSGSLYAQAKCELKGLDDIETKGKTDAEIKAAIEERLAAQGCTDATVSVQSAGSGQGETREVRVGIGCDADVAKASCSTLLEGINLDDDTKTDAELEQMIRERCASMGQGDVEVNVTTQADGERRIGMTCGTTLP